MNTDDTLSLAGMPPGNPSYPYGPYRFIDREYFNVIFESDPAAIRAMVPEPLVPDGSDTAIYEWINMPDVSASEPKRNLESSSPVHWTARR